MGENQEFGLGEGSWCITGRSSKDLSMFPTLSSAKGMISNHYFLSPLLLHLSNSVSFKSIAFLPSLLPWKQLPLSSQEGFIGFCTFFQPLFKNRNQVKILPAEKSSLKNLNIYKYAYLLTFFLVMKQTPIYFGLCIVCSPFNQI